MDELKKSHLGKDTVYHSQYDASLLFAIPRKKYQDKSAIYIENESFLGKDIWFAYELSWLDSLGKPIVKMARFIFSCKSANLIESKSLKLYLNSFNQSFFDTLEEVESCLKRDLSEVAESEVLVQIFCLSDLDALKLTLPKGHCLDHLMVRVNTYSYDPSLLKLGSEMVTETIYTNLLRSTCPVTGQPDWGTVVVDYSGLKIDHAAFLQYICSFRTHQDFHEQCVERIFLDLLHLGVEKLTVFANYTRRGGIEINPWRSNCLKHDVYARLIRQ